MDREQRELEERRVAGHNPGSDVGLFERTEHWMRSTGGRCTIIGTCTVRAAFD